MGTDVRELPAKIAAVSVGVLWGRKHRERRPEHLPVTQVGAAIADVDASGVTVRETIVREGAGLLDTPAELLALGLPLVLYNGLRFDWVALDSLAPAGELIGRTIDIYSALHPCVEDVIDAEGGAEAFPTRGEYGVLHPHRVAETNLGLVPGSGDDVIGEALLAAELWHCLATSERAIVAGRTHALGGGQLAILSGATPALAGEAEWREMLALRPEPTPYRRRTRHPVTFPRVDQRYV